MIAVDSLLARGVNQLGLSLAPEVLQKLADYATLLMKWNKTYNLTAVRDFDQIIALHLLDSLSIVSFLRDDALLDVGSGAGFPGIPVALACPGIAVTLLDSNSKKSAFQQQAVITLGLSNVKVVNARVENFKPECLYSQIVSRAFAELSDFVRETSPLLAKNGRWLAMKGLHPAAEIIRLPSSVKVELETRLSVPGVDAERHLIVIREK